MSPWRRGLLVQPCSVYLNPYIGKNRRVYSQVSWDFVYPMRFSSRIFVPFERFPSGAVTASQPPGLRPVLCMVFPHTSKPHFCSLSRSAAFHYHPEHPSTKETAFSVSVRTQLLSVCTTATSHSELFNEFLGHNGEENTMFLTYVFPGYLSEGMH